MVERGMTSYQNIAEGDQLRNTLAYEFGGLPSYAPRYIAAGLNGNLLDQGDQIVFNETWAKCIKEVAKKRAYAIGNQEEMSNPDSPGGSTYLADGEHTPNASGDEGPAGATRPLTKSRKGKAPVSQLNTEIRFCVFNVGNISKPEFWDIIKGRLTPEILAGVIRVENVTQPNGNKRIDMWVRSKVAMKLKSAMYLTATARREGVKVDYKYPLRELLNIWYPNNRTKHWRIDTYRSWREREVVPTDPRSRSLNPPRRAIATFNVNGIHSKKIELNHFLTKREIGVIAIQETLVDQNAYSLRLPGYDVYERTKTKEFRGQALAVHSSYTSYEVGKDRDNCFIHIKVIGLTQGDPCHIIAVYLPSGGNHRRDATRCLNRILLEYKNIRTKEPHAKVILLGDFNKKRDVLAKLIKTHKSGLKVLSVSGNGMTFHRKSSKWSDIDSIIGSPEALLCLRSAKVERGWSIHPRKDSDHFPLVTQLRAKADIAQRSPPVRYRFNTNLVKGHGKEIVFHNRWSLLPTDPITTVEELDIVTKQFTETVNVIGKETGIKQPIQGSIFALNRALKKRLKAASLARKKWMAAAKEGQPEADELKERWSKMRKAVRKSIHNKELKLEAKKAAQVTEWFRDGEMKAFHRWEANNTVNGARNTSKVTPVLNKEGILLTTKEDIIARTTEYYSELAQDDDHNLSKNQEYWNNKAEVKRTDDLPCNARIEWVNVLLAIRSMALGTAPGDEDIPIEVYKAILKEECHAHLKDQGKTVGEGMYVALPDYDLPPAPCTPMGKQLFRIVNGMWNTAAQPKCWEKVTTISLHKAGDPTDLSNYRGISLIAVGMKIFTVILAMRISTLAELNNLFISEQGGFRAGEEAVAQFIALAEIARRRRLNSLKTWVVFIDFKKAFDKVMHEALFEKLSAMGFRGHFLEVIRNVYTTSKAQVRVGGECGEAYDMIRGTRQGCPLSPILFLVFINDILTHMPKGVMVPGVTVEPKTCPGLLFADDVAGLAETIDDTRNFLEGITRWSVKWKLPIGAAKCGVMLIGGTEEEQRTLKNEEFLIGNERIDVVRKYKYLGIFITDKLGDRDCTDEIAHCKTLASKVKLAVDMRRAFLRDKRFPLYAKIAVINSKVTSVGCYGGEWIGMCQERTSIIQKELNKALKIVLNSSTKSNLHATVPMSIEMGIPTIEQRMTEMRTRLWQKAPKLKTWLGHLTLPENKFEGRVKVWSTGTQHILHRLQPYQSKWGNREINTPPLERIMIDNRVKSMLARNNKYDYIDTPLTTDNCDEPKRQKQEASVAVIARSIYKDMYPTRDQRAVKATIDYMSFGFDRTRDFIKNAVYTPNLTEGIIWLVRLRTGAWWTTKRRAGMLSSRGQDTLNPSECPCCGTQLRNEPEFCHILIDCQKWKMERASTILPLILFLRQRFLHFDSERRLDLIHEKLEIAVLLLGASIRKRDNVPMYKSTRMENTDVRDDTPDPLDAYTCGWGGEGETHIPGLNAHAFTVVAKFLALVMPGHKQKLFLKDNQEESNTDRVAYDTTSWEDSPLKVTKLTRGMDQGSGLETLERDRSETPSPTYPPGNLTRALQTDAMSGMGTRCIHADHLQRLRLLRHRELVWETDEESLIEGEATCKDRCYPRLTIIN